MTTATLTPYDLSETSKVGRRLYRKQVLKKGVIHYKGQRIQFDDAFLTDLAESFKAGAYDQVPFVLADNDNHHNEDPERFRGEVAGFEVTKDGLDALVKVNKQGAKVLEDNPNLGVSARIIQGLQKADGRTFKRAIRHVLGTMDPRVTGLRPWQAVDLSEDDDTEVVDLTAETYQEEGHMAKRSNTKVVDPTTVDLSAMTDNQFLEFLDLADGDEDATAATEGDGPTDDNDTDVDGDTEGTVEDDEDEADATTDDNGVTDVDPDAVGDDDAGEDDDEDDETDLSSDVMDTGVRDELTELRTMLASERFAAERKDLMKAGVPRHLIDLAEPLLSSPDAVMLDLSNSDDPVDAARIVRDMLGEVKGLIDLRPEIGHQVDLSAADQSTEDALLAQWEKEYGTA